MELHQGRGRGSHLGRSGSSAQASGPAWGRGWAGTSWARSEPGSSVTHPQLCCLWLWLPERAGWATGRGWREDLSGTRPCEVCEGLKSGRCGPGQARASQEEQGLGKGAGDSPGRSTGDKGWSWTGNWPLPRKAAPHTHSLGRVARKTGQSTESKLGGHHPGEGMTPSRYGTLWG